MELRFDAMLCSNLGNENSGTDHIKCSRGPQVPHPWFTTYAVNVFMREVTLNTLKQNFACILEKGRLIWRALSSWPAATAQEDFGNVVLKSKHKIKKWRQLSTKMWLSTPRDSCTPDWEPLVYAVKLPQLLWHSLILERQSCSFLFNHWGKVVIRKQIFFENCFLK